MHPSRLTAAVIAFALSAVLLHAADAPVIPAPPLPVIEPVTASQPHQERFVGLFTPFRTERAALSPDGKYLAYSLKEGGNLNVIVIEIDHPEKATAKVTVATDATSTAMLEAQQRELTPARIRWMRWTTPTRLVVDTNTVTTIGTNVQSEWQNRVGTIIAFDANGGNAKILATPKDVAELIPLDVPRLDTGRTIIATSDQPVPSPETSDPTTGEEIDGVTTETRVLPETAESSAQNLQIFDLDLAHPGAVLLQASGMERATGTRQISFYRLESITGKVTDLTDDMIAANKQALTDRQGHARIFVPVSLRAGFPHRYTTYGTTGLGREKSLDELVGTGPASGFTISPDNFFGQRSVPLAFDEDPNLLYYASNLGRDTFGIYSFNLTSGQRGAVRIENPTFDLVGPLDTFGEKDSIVIDRFTGKLAGIRYDGVMGTAAWIRPEWAQAQKFIEAQFPGHTVDLLEWDQTGNRFLAAVNGPGDAGAFYVLDRAQGRLAEFARRAPWIDANQTHRTFPFSFKTADNTALTGLMTVPSHPRRERMPIVLLCPDLPWQRVRAEYNTRIQAFANMGFLVVQLNGRGAWGLGVKHRAALQSGYDLVQVEDIMTTLDYIEKNYNADAKRIAIVGESHGGFVALRALQLHPERFRCAIAVNTPVDLGAWLAEQRWTEGASAPALTRSGLGDAARLKEAPLTSHPELIKKPVLVLHYGGPDGTPRTFTYIAAKQFAAAVRRQGTTAEFNDLTMDYMRGLPKARSLTYEQIEDFLNVQIYDFKVKLGDLQVKPE